MIAKSLLSATVVCLGLFFWVLSECHFLIPYRDLIVFRYGWTVAAYFSCLFLNVVAISYLIGRTLFLKDTGRKLAHLERQVRTGSSISDELSERLRNQ